MRRSWEQIFGNQNERGLLRAEYIIRLDLYSKTEDELRQLLHVYESNQYGRRIFGLPSSRENEIAIDTIKSVISRNGAKRFINGCLEGYVKP